MPRPCWTLSSSPAPRVSGAATGQCRVQTVLCGRGSQQGPARDNTVSSFLRSCSPRLGPRPGWAPDDERRPAAEEGHQEDPDRKPWRDRRPRHPRLQGKELPTGRAAPWAALVRAPAYEEGEGQRSPRRDAHPRGVRTGEAPSRSLPCRTLPPLPPQELGIKTVAVYSTADAEALHVNLADEAVCIGEAASSESYLSMPNLIAAAVSRGADAIHPGYGEREDALPDPPACCTCPCLQPTRALALQASCPRT